MKKNEKLKSGLYLVIFIAIVCGLGYLVAFGFGKQHKGKAEHIQLGLDLAGGVSVTYEINENNPDQKDINDTILRLKKRVDRYSTEADVYQEGAKRINVEIPGVTDANKILAELGKPGGLSFVDEEGNVLLTGSDVKNADAVKNESSVGETEYLVQLKFNDEGKEKFAKATKDNLGKVIYVVYDNQVVSAPTVEAEITEGEAVINNIKTFEEADDLATTIRIGALPLELKEMNSKVVGAKLGQEAIKTSLMAGLIGIIVVCLFMIVIYLFPGFVASLALGVYILLLALALNGFNVTLTLPGIAGIILSIGMAVDANVIIFTRIKEEIRNGSTVKTAIDAGFHKALSAIVDGNVTTLIAAAVLWIMGTGSVKGFAQTLAIGIILSMFTAIVVSKSLVKIFYALGVQSPKLYGKAKEVKVFNFIKISKVCIVLSLVVIILGLVFMPVNSGMKGRGKLLNFSLDFQGGTSITATFDKEYTLEDAEKEIKPVVQEVSKDKNIEIQTVDDTKQVVIKTRELTLEERTTLEDKFKSQLSATAFETENISSSISGEMRRDAIIAVIIATICMLIYIAVRFKDFKFGASAVLALIHDVLIVFMVYSVAYLSVGNTFIACMLTILGYSINATIIIFDRIRENLGTMRVSKVGLETVVNTSISQTFTRTINTSITTFVMIAILFIMGVPAIKEFALTLMVGIVGGAYSSVCITGPIWFFMKKGLEKKTSK